MKIVEDMRAKHIVLYQLMYYRLSAQRAEHCMAVAERASTLAVVSGVSEEAAWLAALGHDLCREEKEGDLVSYAENSGYMIEKHERDHPIFLHGKAAVGYLRRYYPLDEAIYFAIAHHTLGHPTPTKLLLLLYIADATSKDRAIDLSLMKKLKGKSLELQCCTLVEYQRQKYTTLSKITQKMYEYCQRALSSM